MDNINEIRKRDEEFRANQLSLSDDNYFKASSKACLDRTVLLDYISALEEKLRWKKVAEEKPPLGERVEVRTKMKRVEIASPEVDMLPDADGVIPYWLGDRLYPYHHFIEWREI